MAVRIVDLADRDLDRIVSLARGETPYLEDHRRQRERLALIQGPMAEAVLAELAKGLPHVVDVNRRLIPLAAYSSNWADGGPIIESMRIAIRPDRDGGWLARREGALDHQPWTHGPTPLVAAMRCFAIGELGEFIELPWQGF